MILSELLAAYPERIRLAFIAGIRELQDQAQVNELVRALERGDVQAAVDVLYVESAAYREFQDVLEAGYGDGGASQIAELGRLEDQQGNRFVFRFSARNYQAERIIRDYSSQRITAIVNDQRRAIRTALEEGLSRGDNPRTSALNVIGRVDRRTQRRIGGIIGLSAPQERAVSSARRELGTGEYGSYFRRERRDRRFDSLVRRAQREERALTQAEIQRLTGRYSDRLLALRGEAISRTETLSALNMGRYQAIEQLIDTGKVRRQDVTLVWNAAKDLRTRDTHRVLDGESVPFGEAFTTMRGASLRYPGDPRGGAAEVVNCRCNLQTRIDYRSNRG